MFANQFFAPLYTAQRLDAVYDRMKQSDIRCSRDSLLFSVEWYPGKFVFLEEGDNRTGLEHIRQRRGQVFTSFNIPIDQIPIVLNRAVSRLPLLSYTKWNEIRKQDEHTQLYGYNDTVAFVLTVGSNGYIVSGWPIPNCDAQALIKEEDYIWKVKCEEPISGMCSGLTEDQQSPLECYVRTRKRPWL